jgi:membrane protein YqaA with SNARE-associated domain
MKKPSIKKLVAHKAAKAAAKHTVHGSASKLKREPVRATTLLTIGSVVGAVAGWLLARGSRVEPQPSA